MRDTIFSREKFFKFLGHENQVKTDGKKYGMQRGKKIDGEKVEYYKI